MSTPNPSTTDWVPLWANTPGAAGNRINYLGGYVAGTYNQGDIVVWSDGTAYLCVKDGTITPPEPWPGPAPPSGGTGIPLPVQNGKWIKGLGGAAVWATISVLDHQSVPACRVCVNGNYNAPSGGSNLPMDYEYYDTDNMHDIVTNNQRITMRTAGLYFFQSHVSWNPSTGGVHRLISYAPSSGGIRYSGIVATMTSGAVRVEANMVRRFNVGEYVDVGVYQDTGAALICSGEKTLGPEATATWLGP